MSRPLLVLEDTHLTFGGNSLLDGAAFVVAERERLCLVGRNGSGKSTLLKIAAGLIQPDSGKRFAHPDATIAYLPQEADFTGFENVGAYVYAGVGPFTSHGKAERLLADLGLTGEETTQQLSGGEARRAALARVLVGEPDVILLDEPTNHLDLPAIEWLEAKLKSSRSALVLISHDRRFLEALSNTTLWLDRGKTRRAELGFSAFEDWRDALLEEEEADRHKLDRKIAREQQWMHGGVTGRRKRNVRRVRELAAMREQKREARAVTGNVVLTVSEGRTSGRIVVETQGITKSYGGLTVVDGLSTRIARGDRVGIVGPNGAGKTTIIKLLTGALAPDSGEIRLGTNLEMITIDQRRDELDPSWTLGDALTGGRGDQVVVNGHARHVASYMKDFLFDTNQVRTPVSVLSGGERARLLLARSLAKPSNLLVLDEPTNDLDLETLDLLQEMIAAYDGTVLLVSHDRDFLDRCVTSVIVSEGNGRWTEYAGGYTDMLAQRGAAMPAAKPGPASAGLPLQSAGTFQPTVRSAKRKLSFKEKHALETLPGRIETLSAQAQRLETVIGDPALYARDRARFDKATAELAGVRGKLAEAEDEWLVLELRRAEVEG